MLIAKSNERKSAIMTIHRIKKNGSEIFALEGRLDITTSPQLHEVLLPAIDGTADLLLDFSKLVYISSAGLRVLLAAQKESARQGVEMKLQGVSAAIMEVFDMTGFSDILTIQ